MAVEPVVVALTQSGALTAQKIAGATGYQVHGRAGRVDAADVHFGDTIPHLQMLFATGTPIVAICASGIVIRALAPMLMDKHQEPPVLSVSDDGGVVVPLLGGHRGANGLAHQIAETLGGVAAVTTAGDVAFGVALDEPPKGWHLENPEHAAKAMASLLSGGGVTVGGPDAGLATWADRLPKGDSVGILASIAPVDVGEHTLIYRPQRVTLGVGCSRDCPVQELDTLVSQCLVNADIAPTALAAIGTIDVKADEPAILALAAKYNVPLRLFSAAELEAQAGRLKNPSDVVFEEVGCHGVSEAAALSLAGRDANLHLEKQKSAMATCALALAEHPIGELAGRVRGRLSVVGIGPGQAGWRTPEVSQFVSQAEELVGYGLYIDLLGGLAKGKTRTDFPLGGEEDRCRYALEQAGKGKNVALICSGDAGIYAMGALVFELLDRGPDQQGVSDAARRVDVVCSPGVSALQGAAARAGAPLGHDFCAISLSDLLTPRDDILKRLQAAAQSDFVIAFYNPVSRRRRTLLAEARDILLQHRPADTPVMLASSLGRAEENVRYRRLADLQVDEVDMLTVVLIGSSQSRLAQLGEGPRMYTPRGYARKIDGDLS